MRSLALLGAANVIPGPTSTELAIHLGWVRGRWLGLLVAGVSFIAPAMLMTGILGWLYVQYGELPDAAGILYGVKPVMVAVVLHALFGLAPKAARTWLLRVSGCVALGLLWFGIGELVVLFGIGAAVMLAALMTLERAPSGALFAVPCSLGKGAAGTAAVAAVATAATPTGLFLVFAKIGSVLFGSGYVLLAFLRTELVERLGWLTEAQCLDAIAVGQVTPGPVFTTATFVGYVADGSGGALAATAGIFLPAFLFVAVLGPFVPWLRRSRATAALLDGVTVASVALMIDVSLQLMGDAVCDVWSAVIGVAALVAMLRWRVGTTWLLAGGALLGLVLVKAELAG